MKLHTETDDEPQADLQTKTRSITPLVVHVFVQFSLGLKNFDLYSTNLTNSAN